MERSSLNNGHYFLPANVFKALPRQEGFTLLELIVMIILLGLTVPAILGLFMQLSASSAKSEIYTEMAVYGEEKMEQVLAVKDKNWDWYKRVYQFKEDVNLPHNFHRTVSVQKINNWGNAYISAWQIEVNVTHPQLPSGYKLTVRLTQYHE